MSAQQCKPIANIKAVLFDMDGLLIDSEGIYTNVVNDLLRPYGKEQTWEIKANLMGKPERESTYTLLSSLWPPSKEGESFAADCPFTIDSFLKERNVVIEQEFTRVPPMKGAVRLIKHLAKHNIPICVATGSKRKNFDIKTSSLGELFSPFSSRVICGDDARLTRGKPHPDIFLLAAREGLLASHDNEQMTKEHLGHDWVDRLRSLGPNSDGIQYLKGAEKEILVFEDAKPGVEAAKAAGMHVVWIPDPNLRALFPDEELGASQTIDSLLDFEPTTWGLPSFDDAVAS